MKLLTLNVIPVGRRLKGTKPLNPGDTLGSAASIGPGEASVSLKMASRRRARGRFKESELIKVVTGHGSTSCRGRLPLG